MPKAKILVVDDDPDLVRAMRLRLRANNYDVTTASDGYGAIASAQKERPALIILDLGLPVGRRFRGSGSLAEQRYPLWGPGDRTECARPSGERGARSEGRGIGLFPEARGQRRIDECDPDKPDPWTNADSALAVVSYCQS